LKLEKQTIISNVNKTVTDLTAHVTGALDKKHPAYNESVIQNMIHKIKVELGGYPPLYGKNAIVPALSGVRQ